MFVYWQVSIIWSFECQLKDCNYRSITFPSTVHPFVYVCTCVCGWCVTCAYLVTVRVCVCVCVSWCNYTVVYAVHELCMLC